MLPNGRRCNFHRQPELKAIRMPWGFEPEDHGLYFDSNSIRNIIDLLKPTRSVPVLSGLPLLWSTRYGMLSAFKVACGERDKRTEMYR